MVPLLFTAGARSSRVLASNLARVSAIAIMTAMCWTAPARAADVMPVDDSKDGNTLLLADALSYDQDANTVTASGYVEIQRGNRLLLADKIVYDRNTDVATASGHVSLTDVNGSVLFFESIQVAGDLKEGLASEVRVLLSDKSRMASRLFRRNADGTSELSRAVYSACDSCEGESPVWQIKAAHVRYDPEAEMVYYRNAWIEFGGVPTFYTPYLAHPDPTAGPKSGLLLPTIGAGRNLGVSFKLPYYIHLGSDHDATITPFLTTEAGKGAIGEYRQDFQEARVRIFGSLMAKDPDFKKDLRGHLDANARWDMTDAWRSGSDIRLATDRTYLRRYNFLAPTWLTSNLFAERFDTNNYFSANAYYFQRQRIASAAGSVPGVFPALSYNYTGDPDSIGGYWSVDGNGLALFREDGTDTSRGSMRLGWNLPFKDGFGGDYKFRAGVRGDGYYVRDLIRASKNDVFTGTAGRVLPEASLEWRMPFVSDALNFNQLLEPIVMGVVSPIGGNSDSIPNEDSLDLQFDDTNLFTRQRFTGIDRVETGARVNYGLRYAAFNRSIGTVSAVFGQVYRFHADSVFTQQSGLAGHFSDYVGHVDLTPNPYVTLQYRFRLDKNSFASRRSELNAAVGPELLRVSSSYIFVKSNGTPSVPNSTEELFIALSSRFARNWSIVASHRQNLGVNGGPIRTDIGLTYEDECAVIGLEFANDNTQDRDFKKGLAVVLRISMKTVGDIKFNSNVGAER